MMRAILGRWRMTVALGAVLAAGGCTSYRVETVPVAQVVAARGPRSLLLTLRSNREVEVFGPVIFDDSLRGHPRAESVQRLSVALADILTVRTRHFNPAKSLLSVFGVAAGVFVYNWLMGLNGQAF